MNFFVICSVSTVCDDSDCLHAASSLLRTMDPTADPCEDFHQYACGGWLKETPIPPGYPVWDRFQELSYKNMYMLKNLIGIQNELTINLKVTLSTCSTLICSWEIAFINTTPCFAFTIPEKLSSSIRSLCSLHFLFLAL